ARESHARPGAQPAADRAAARAGLRRVRCFAARGAGSLRGIAGRFCQPLRTGHDRFVPGAGAARRPQCRRCATGRGQAVAAAGCHGTVCVCHIPPACAMGVVRRADGRPSHRHRAFHAGPDVRPGRPRRIPGHPGFHLAVSGDRQPAGCLDQHPRALVTVVPMLLPAVLFIATLTFVIWQPRGLGIGWSASAGAALALATGVVHLADVAAVWQIVWNATATFIAIIITSIILDAAGFFEWAALHVARWGRGRGHWLFALVVLLGAAVSALFANDGAALIMTPIVMEMLLALGF